MHFRQARETPNLSRARDKSTPVKNTPASKQRWNNNFFFFLFLFLLSRNLSIEKSRHESSLHPFRSSREANVGNGTDIYNI